MPMLDRRVFLAASVCLAADRNLSALPASPVLLVLDRRFTSLGTSMHANIAFIEGDVTALWRDRLNDLWKVGTTNVAGITEPAALFCLEQLARGCGRKVSMRQSIPGTTAIRWVISPVASQGLT
jgi:hypothetical protein